MTARWNEFLVIFLVVTEAIIITATSASDLSLEGKDGDLVTNLPGQPPVNFKHYAGYVTLDTPANQRALFYWFFEVDHPNPSSRPVVLWLQGGPGCSSIGYGAMSEIGPFLVENRKLKLNEYSWTKEANLIFLESPTGVGFSSVEDSKYIYTDDTIALDTRQFLKGFFQKFPEYSTNELYLAGESYAGHYIPVLAKKILEDNINAANSSVLNLKGFQIGNPWTDSYMDNRGTLDWYLSHSLISEETSDLALRNCNLNDSYFIGEVGNNKCQQASLQINEDVQEIDIDNIYADHCNKENSTSTRTDTPKNQFRFQPQHKLFSATLQDQNNHCASDQVEEYLNRPEVQTALHVKGVPTKWAGCSSSIYTKYNHEDLVASMVPVYEGLFKYGIRIWIYSGDWDANVPTTGTRRWIKSLKLAIVTKWYPWDYLSQVGGWSQAYQGLTFTTVRAAGHMVPSDQPEKALMVFNNFLSGSPLPVFHFF